uniref:Uncharacterized protein n=1 Tax=Anguilla anguilla TaxID=7936 RepID=A0A0E9Q7V5_ANGAN
MHSLAYMFYHFYRKLPICSIPPTLSREKQS